MKRQRSSPGLAQCRIAVMLPAPAVKWWHLVATVASGAVAFCPQDPGTRGEPRLSLSCRLGLGKLAELPGFLISSKWEEYVLGYSLGDCCALPTLK